MEQAEDAADSGTSTPAEEEVSDEIVIQDEAALPEDGKVYPKEAHPNAGKGASRPAGLLPGGGEALEEHQEKKQTVVRVSDVCHSRRQR